MDLYYKDEIEEAIEAADNALDALYDALDLLNKATGWGIFDMVGGGLIASFAKRQKMNEAQKAMDDARESLLIFRDEIGDVDYETDLELGINDFVSFTDVFFDNIFSDIAIQNRIADAKDKIDNTIERVRDIRTELCERLRDFE